MCAWRPSARRGPRRRRFSNEHHPDIMLLDIRMPDLSGLAAGEAILAAHPEGAHRFPHHLRRRRLHRARAGDRGPRLPHQAGSSWSGRSAAFRHGRPNCPGIRCHRPRECAHRQRPANGAGAAFDDSLSHPDNSQAAPAFAEGLTQRERDIAELIAEGLDNREIAQALYLSEGTVRNHISAILQKCGLRNRTQIAIAWWR